MRKEPFLLYLWSPHWFFGEYDMVGVQLPEHKTCDSFTEANNWKDCGTAAWPATGWAKDYTMNYGNPCLLYTSPSPRDATLSRMPSSA